MGMPGQPAKAYKWTTHQARERFQVLWNQTNWSSRESVLNILPFLLRAYALVPRCSIHIAVDEALAGDCLRIRNGELRRLVRESAKEGSGGAFHDQ